MEKIKKITFITLLFLIGGCEMHLKTDIKEDEMGTHIDEELYIDAKKLGEYYGL